ncbi:MAG: fibronectin type III domain-containing protein [Phycisphaerales bacterium]|nr:fibronectin type III domain-containing protein [Phycisphaerales bacterium]
MENLESRLLLSVSSADYAQIRAMYSDLNLSSDMSSYNVIEIDAADLSDAAIRAAITEAGTTPGDDLIVCRTTTSQNSITLTGGELYIAIDAATQGSLAIVSLGDTPLTIDAGQQSRVMCIWDGNVALGGLTIVNGNISGSDGGGICNYSSGTLTVTDSTITGNHADGNGGGIYNYGNMMMTNSIVTGNTAGSGGGGIYHVLGVLTVTNSAITGNTANNGGGLYDIDAASITVTNSTIAGNAAASAGGGISNSYSPVTLVNSIVVHNSAAAGSDISRSYGKMNGYNNLTTFTEWDDSQGNVSYDSGRALFVDEANGDYQLAAGSQAINKGDNTRAAAQGLTGSSLDLAGNPRIVDGTIDIGAFEFQGSTTQELNAPASASVSNVGSQSVTLSWEKATEGSGGEEADGYKVEWYVGDTLVGYKMVTSGNTLSTVITGLQPETAYTFRVYTTANGDSSTDYASVSATTTSQIGPASLVPDASVKAPTKPKASLMGSQSVTLSWVAAAGDGGMNGYQIEWYVKKTFVGSMTVAGSDITSAEIDGLQPGVAYSFRIYTTTSDGKISAKYVNVSAKTKAAPAPLSVKAKADGMNAIVISWSAPKATTVPSDLDVVGYKIYDSSGNLVGTAAAGDTSFRVADLSQPNGTYSFRIVAVYQPKSGGAMVESSKAVTVKAKTTAFLAPKLVKAMDGDRDATSITLRWLVSPDADGFDVTCLQNKMPIVLDFSDGGNASFIRDSNDKIVGVTITGLNPGTKYAFAIRGTNSVLDVESAILKVSVATLKLTATKTA